MTQLCKSCGAQRAQSMHTPTIERWTWVLAVGGTPCAARPRSATPTARSGPRGVGPPAWGSALWGWDAASHLGRNLPRGGPSPSVATKKYNRNSNRVHGARFPRSPRGRGPGARPRGRRPCRRSKIPRPTARVTERCKTRHALNWRLRDTVRRFVNTHGRFARVTGLPHGDT